MIFYTQTYKNNNKHNIYKDQQIKNKYNVVIVKDVKPRYYINQITDIN